MAKIGRLIGCSLGPGDPELITRKAWHTLSGTAHWCYPVRRKQAESYALDIATQAGLTPENGQTELVFPMTHDVTKLAGYWQRAAETTLGILQQGTDVAFLVEGDASTYSTFSHLSRTVTALQPDIAIEVIPGISSYHAAAAATNRPLADTDDTIAVVPAGYGIDMIEQLLPQFDTIVLLKVKPLLQDIIELLQKYNLLQQSYFVEKVGSSEQQVVLQMQQLVGVTPNYLSLIVVHNHNRERGTVQRGCRKKNSDGAEA